MYKVTVLVGKEVVEVEIKLDDCARAAQLTNLQVEVEIGP